MVLVGVEAAVAGRDCAGTLREFKAWFPDDEACRRYLAGLRWRGGFVCAVCGGVRAGRMSRGGDLRCAQCRTHQSVGAGTIFADPRLPLTTWFAACYLTGGEHGVSALGRQRPLVLGSYERAGAPLHTLRRALVRPGGGRLAGQVEVDETAIGPCAPGRLGQGTFVDRALVAIAVEARPRGARGRIRLARTPHCSGLTGFVTDAAAHGAAVCTDRWRGDGGLATAAFVHQATSTAGGGHPAHVLMPRAHRVSSLPKRRLLGTHQAALRPHQPDYSLDELALRFHRRSSRQHALPFHPLLAQAAQIDHVPITAIAGGRP